VAARSVVAATIYASTAHTAPPPPEASPLPHRCSRTRSSDGGDNRSRYTQGEIKSVLKEAGGQVYAVDIFERYPKTPEEKSGLLALDEVTGVTGGRVFLTHDADELHRAVRQISEELRTQYVLGYSLNRSARDGKWHKIKVALNNPKSKNFRIYAKKGYYGPVDR